MALGRARALLARPLGRGYASCVRARSTRGRADARARFDDARGRARAEPRAPRRSTTAPRRARDATRGLTRTRDDRRDARRISVTVMRDGVRATIDAREGETLASAMARDATTRSAAPVMSIDRGPDAHVLIPDEFLARLPALDALEMDKLEDVAVGPGANSRLASQVTLTKEVDGLVAAIAKCTPRTRCDVAAARDRPPFLPRAVARDGL